MSQSLLRQMGLWRELEKEAAVGLSHAYIFLTSDLVAANELCTMLAKRVMCEKGGCGNCPQCAKINSNSHPDVKFYENASKLNVKDAEMLIEDTIKKGLSGNKKLYFLQNADGMSTAVQNKLLKTYEEPPAGVTLILQAASETALLPTVRSRAKKLYLEQFSAQQLADELTEMDFDRDSAETAAYTAAGSLTDALKFASDDAFLSRYESVFDLLLNLKKSGEIPQYLGSELFQKENAATTFDFIERIVWDALKARIGSERPRRRLPDYLEIGKKISPQAAAQISVLVNEARKKLSLNLSPGTAAESLLFGILEAKYQWQTS